MIDVLDNVMVSYSEAIIAFILEPLQYSTFLIGAKQPGLRLLRGYSGGVTIAQSHLHHDDGFMLQTARDISVEACIHLRSNLALCSANHHTITRTLLHRIDDNIS